MIYPNIVRLVSVLVVFCFTGSSYMQQTREIQPGIFGLAWNPDGTLLAVASDGLIIILNMNGEVISTFDGHSAEVFSVAWSPDGQYLATGGYGDRFVNIWSLSTNQLFQKLLPSNVTDGAGLYAGAGPVSWNPTGTRLIATSFDTFQFWDTETWLPIDPYRGGSMRDAAWSPDGTVLALSNIYGLIFYDGEKLQLENREFDFIDILGEHPAQLTWSADSNLLATTDQYDPLLSVWDVETRTRVGMFTDTTDKFVDIAYIADDRIAAITEGGTFYVIDNTGTLISTYESGVEQVRAMAWNPSLEIFAVGGAESRIDEDGWDGFAYVPLEDVMQAPAIQPGVYDLAWNPEGTLLAVANPDGLVVILDTDGDVVTTFDGHSHEVFSIAWSPDGQYIASGGYNDQFINVWSLSTGKLSRQLLPSGGIDSVGLYAGAGHIAWDPTGTRLLATAFDTYQFWNTETWLPNDPYRSGSIRDALWSPDGSTLAITDIYSLSFDNGKTLLLEDIEADVVDIRDENPAQLAWSADSNLLATTDQYDPLLSVWDVEARTRVGMFTDTTDKFVDITYIADDRIAAITEGGTFYVIDNTGTLISTYESGVEQVRAMAWNPALEIFAVGGAESRIDEDGWEGFAYVPLEDVMPFPPAAGAGTD